MSTERTVQFAGEAQDRATLLLAAAEDLGHPVEVVRTVTGAFVAPQDVVEKAGLLDEADPLDDEDQADEPKSEEPKKAPAKKAAKKAPAKKAAAKKAAAKKAAAKPDNEE